MGFLNLFFTLLVVGLHQKRNLLAPSVVLRITCVVFPSILAGKKYVQVGSAAVSPKRVTFGLLPS